MQVYGSMACKCMAVWHASVWQYGMQVYGSVQGALKCMAAHMRMHRHANVC